MVLIALFCWELNVPLSLCRPPHPLTKKLWEKEKYVAHPWTCESAIVSFFFFSFFFQFQTKLILFRFCCCCCCCCFAFGRAGEGLAERRGLWKKWKARFENLKIKQRLPIAIYIFQSMAIAIMEIRSSLRSMQMPSSEMQISDEMHAQIVSSQVCILKISIMVFPRYGLLIVWLKIEDQNVWSICSQLWTEKYREKTRIPITIIAFSQLRAGEEIKVIFYLGTLRSLPNNSAFSSKEFLATHEKQTDW